MDYLDIRFDVHPLLPNNLLVQKRTVPAHRLMDGAAADGDHVMLPLINERNTPILPSIWAGIRPIGISRISCSGEERFKRSQAWDDDSCSESLSHLNENIATNRL